jgi:hypothetical protein
MPRLRPPPMPMPPLPAGSPAVRALATIEVIEASDLSSDAKAAAKMLILNNLVLGRGILSGHRLRIRVPSKASEPPRFPDPDEPFDDPEDDPEDDFDEDGDDFDEEPDEDEAKD